MKICDIGVISRSCDLREQTRKFTDVLTVIALVYSSRDVRDLPPSPW